MKNNKIINMTLIALFTAVIVVCTFVSIPIPGGVPVTLQTLAIAASGYVLGAKKGVSSVIIYIMLGLVGIPVFSGFNSGLGALVGFTGGFIYGFIPLALMCGLAHKFTAFYLKIAMGIAGLLACHALGAMQYAALANIDFYASVMLVSVPYLIKDIFSIVCALAFSKILFKNSFCKDICTV